MSLDATGIVITLVVAAIVALVGVSILGAAGAPAEIERERAVARAYCYQAFGDGEVYVANVVMNHGGFHCVANDGAPHYHEVTAAARHAAVVANRSGRAVNWTGIGRYKDRGPTERWLHQTVDLLPVALGVAGLAVGAGAAQWRRADNTDEAETEP